MSRFRRSALVIWRLLLVLFALFTSLYPAISVGAAPVQESAAVENQNGLQLPPGPPLQNAVVAALAPPILDAPAAEADRSTGSASLLTVTSANASVTPSATEISACDSITFTITLSNDATQAEGVVVTSTMGPGFTPSYRRFDVGTLAPTETVTITSLYTGTCNAISGQHTATVAQDGATSFDVLTEYTVLPGALTIVKEPSVIEASIGDVVTWTVTVENTGYGRIDNVLVTDVLGAGLMYVAGSQYYGSEFMLPGEISTFDISAEVIACQELDNVVTATWGCDLTAACQTQSAKASIDLILETPHLEYDVPEMWLDSYCHNPASQVFTIPITNTGTGTAYTPTIESLYFTGLSVNVLSPGASYSFGDFSLPDLAPGATYNLVFELSYAGSGDPCNASYPTSEGRDLVYANYYDDCDEPWFFPVQYTRWGVRGSNPAVSLDLNKDMPLSVNLDEVFTATVNVQYSGPISCTGSTLGPVMVTDTVPTGFTILDADGGTVSGQVITWTLTVTEAVNATFDVILQSPPYSECLGYCGEIATNRARAWVGNCCGCMVTDTDTDVTAIDCSLEIGYDKSHSTTGELCETIYYTNTYAFPVDSFLDPVDWNTLIFTEEMNSGQSLVALQPVAISNGISTCNVFITPQIIDGELVLDFSSADFSSCPPLQGSTLTIAYSLDITNSLGCNRSYAFYDWSHLDTGLVGGGACGIGGTVNSAEYISLQNPAMTIAMSGVPDSISACWSGQVTLLITRTSTMPAYDVQVFLPTDNYSTTGSISYGGDVSPLSGPTVVPGGVVWDYGDLLAGSVDGATITIGTLKKDCDAASTFAPRVYWDNLCNDDGTPDQSCSAAASKTPDFREPNPISQKMPEVIFADGDVVTWTLTIINSGAGIAHDVIMTDMLGSGLVYKNATITSGYFGSETIITSTNLITFLVEYMYPGEERIAKVSAEIIGCDDLTNRSACWVRCLDEDCCPKNLHQSHVELPPTHFLTTNTFNNPAPSCFTDTVTVTVKNAGLLSVYDSTIIQELPVGLDYQNGSTEYSVDGGSTWLSGGEPSIAGQVLTWGYDDASLPFDTLLQRLYPDDILYLRFTVNNLCNFDGGSLRVRATYNDVCDTAYTPQASTYRVESQTPELRVRKDGRLVGETEWVERVDAQAGDQVEWRIRLDNGNAATIAQDLLLTDTLPSNMTFDGIWASTTITQVVPQQTWQVANMDPGDAETMIITATVNAPSGCTSSDTTNRATISWGCPILGCRSESTSDTATLRTRPVFPEANLTATTTIPQCGGVITVTMTNDGPIAYNVTLTDTLLAGLVYSETLSTSTAPSSSPAPGATAPAWSWATLPAGTVTVTFSVRNSALSGDCQTISDGNSALQVGYEDSCGNEYASSKNIATDALSPSLTVGKTPATLTTDVNDTITWTVRITNTGDGPGYHFNITDVVGSSFDNITATAGSYISPTGSITFPATIVGSTITWSPDDIPATGIWQAQVSARIVASGDNDNVVTATVNCDTGCVLASASDAGHVTLLEDFAKGPAVQTDTIGSLIQFTFTTNLPDEDGLYENVRLTDTLPTGLGYVSSAITYTYDADASGTGPHTVTGATPSIAPSYLASGDMVWDLGNLTGTISVNGLITATIQDMASNDDETRLTNNLTMSYTDGGQDYAYEDSADVDVVEPILHIGKGYETTSGCTATLMLDAFNDSDLSNWSFVNSGDWSVVDDKLRNINSANHRRGFVGETDWTDYSLSAMVRSTDDNGRLGLIFRAQSGTGDYYRFYWDQSVCRFETVVGNSASTLANASIGGYQANRWYHLEIQVLGDTFYAYIDGELVLTATDGSETYEQGRVGVYAHRQDYVEFNDTLVTRLGDAACYVGANETVTYTLTVTNYGTTTGHDLIVTDTIPAGMSFASATTTTSHSGITTISEPTVGDTGVLIWRFSHLDGGASIQSTDHQFLRIDMQLLVADTITATTALQNQAELAYASLPSGGPVGEARDYSGGTHSTAVRTIDPGILKDVDFTPPPDATLGTVVTYTLTVPQRPITATLYNVTVMDLIDDRLDAESAQVSGGTNPSVNAIGGTVIATYDAIPHGTQSVITITTRISDTLGAVDTDVLPNFATLSHDTGVVASNQVSTTVKEPDVNVVKAVTSSTGSTSDLDSTALLTYTLALTNNGTSAAYSVYVTDTAPAGLHILSQTGGDARSGPQDNPTAMTWSISAIPTSTTTYLTYTAQISGALSSETLTNMVDVLYHSLTDTIPGVRAYTDDDDASVETAELSIAKSSAPDRVRIGDIATYNITITIPAGIAGLGGSSFVRDVLPPGMWYITNSETLDWTNVTSTPYTPVRSAGTEGASQVITWTFGSAVTAAQNTSATIAIQFQAQAVGQSISTLADLWPDQNALVALPNTASLTERGTFVDDDTASNQVMQPDLLLNKDSVPASGSYVGANDLITYTLTITNNGIGPAYDIVVSDALPNGIHLVSSQLSGSVPPTMTLSAQPIAGATGVITYRINALWGRLWNGDSPGVATLTIVGQVADDIGAVLNLTNQASIPYYDTQPGDGPGPFTPDERDYSDGSDSVNHITVNGGITKSVDIGPTSQATLGSTVDYVLTVPAQPITATLYNVVVTDTLDNRFDIESVTVSSGFGAATNWSGQTVTATIPAIPHNTQAIITVTARISDALGAVDTDRITNTAQMDHDTWTPVDSNEVNTDIYEPDVEIVKAVTSSSGSTSDLDGTALLTYTLALTNHGTSPAYSLYITDAVPAGLHVLTQAGGDARSGPQDAPNALTWSIDQLATTATTYLTYTAQISGAVSDDSLANAVDVLCHSLTDTIPGVRDYSDDSSQVIHTANISVTKQVWPARVRIGDRITYTLGITIPAGTEGLGSNSYLRDILPPGVWYITGSENLSAVNTVGPVISPSRDTGTQGASQVITWTFTSPITATQAADALVILTFQAQAVGQRYDSPATALWPNQATLDPLSNDVGLWQRGRFVGEDAANNQVMQPQLALRKVASLEDGSYVGANDTLTYQVVITNNGPGPAYDILISDTLPPGMAVALTSLSSPTPLTATLDFQPAVGATGVITWRLSALWGTQQTGGPPGVAIVTIGAVISDSIGANLTLTNTVSIPEYDTQPSDGPGPYTPRQRSYADGSDSVYHRTVNGEPFKAASWGVGYEHSLGATIYYSLVIPAEPITATLYNVVITDLLDSRLRIHDVQVGGGTGTSAGWSGQTVTATLASIPHGTVADITVEAVLSDTLGAMAGDTITNTFDMAHETAPPVTSNETSIEVDEPDLDIDKAVDRTLVGANETVTYTVAITNATGANVSPAHSLILTDIMPSGMRDATPSLIGVTLDSSPIGGLTPSYNSGTGVWVLTFGSASVPAGGELLITYTQTVDADVPLGSVMTNTVQTIWSSQSGDVGSERPYGPIQDQTTILTEDTVTFVKAVDPAIATIGDLITYTVTVPQTPVTAALLNVRVTDTLDSRLWIETVNTGGGTGASAGWIGQHVTATFDAILPDTQAVVTITTRVSDTLGAAAGDTINNTAQMRHDSAAPTISNQVSTDIVEPSLTIGKAVTTTAAYVGANEAITYTVAITNATGATISPAYNLVVTDTLPVGMRDATPTILNITINGLTVSSGDYSANYAGGTGVLLITFTPSLSLPVSGALRIQYEATMDNTVPAGASFTNTAETDWSSLPGDVPGDRDYGPIDDSTTIYTTSPADLLKAVDRITATVGSQIVYTIDIPEPPITATLYNVVMTDDVPSALEINAVSANAGYSGNQVTASLASIAAETQATIIITTTVRNTSTVTDGLDVVNRARYVWENAPSGGTTSPPIWSDPVTTTIEVPALIINKTVNQSAAEPGDVITYTVVVTNVGSGDAYNVDITDVLPAPGFLFMGGTQATWPEHAGTYTTGPTGTGSAANPLHWDLNATLRGGDPVGDALTLTFRMGVNGQISDTVTYTNTAQTYGDDLEGAAIPPDNTDHVADDTDPDDRDTAVVEGLEVRLGDFVWWDWDMDANQNELPLIGVPNALITLTDGLGNTWTDTTDANGYYIFESLRTGVYTVTLGLGSLPNGTTVTTADVQTTTLTAAFREDLTLDFGIVGPGWIGDYVWFDIDANGTQDTGEIGLPNVVITLTFDSAVLTTTTDASGYYSFTNLLLDWVYTTTIDVDTLPPSWVLSTPSTFTSELTLGAPNNDTHDYGAYGPGYLGDYVWFDYDGDGQQDSDEPGIEGAVITLAYGSAVLTTTTDADGLYEFDNLVLEETYTTTVSIPSLPSGTSLTTPGSNSIYLSVTRPYTTTHDYGVVGSGEIGDYVWFDQNADGVQDPDEMPIEGAVITLTFGSSVFTTTTDANGYYLFDDLLLDETYTTTISTASLPPNSSLSTDSSFTTTLTQANPTDYTHDYGVYGPGQIGDYVWYDVNGDGVWDDGEPPVAGVLITLTWDATLITTTTDANGDYVFENLILNTTYTTTIDLDTTPPNTALTTDPSFTVTLTPSEPQDHLHDYGLRGPGWVGDLVWYDYDGDGVPDPGEPGLDNVQLDLIYGGELISTTYTNNTGYYTFDGLLLDNTYTVQVVPLPGFYSTTPTLFTTTLTLADPDDDTLDYGFNQQFNVEKVHWHDHLCPGWGQRYTIELFNDTEATFTNVVVTDTLPSTLRYADTSWPGGGSTDGVYNPATHEVVWHLDSLGPNELVRLTLHVYVRTDVAIGDWIVNTVAVDSHETVETVVTNTFEVACTAPAPTPTATNTPTPTRTVKPPTPTGTVTPGPSATPTPTITWGCPQTIVLRSEVDTHIESAQPKANLANEGTLKINSTGSQRALLRFQLPDLPAGTVIQDARLELTTFPGGSLNVPLPIGAYALNRDWSASQVTWLDAASGTPWQQPGADGEGHDRAAAPADIVMVGNGNYARYGWEITGLAQQWATNPDDNHGVILIGDNSVMARFYFLSSESFMGEDQEPQLVLVICGPTPEPTATHTPSMTPTPTATWTPTATATGTPTPSGTPLSELVLTGLVYDAQSGMGQPVAGATVSVLTCGARRYQKPADADGRYELKVPEQHLLGCDTVTIEVVADGYELYAETVAVADLQAQPKRDMGLTPLAPGAPTPTGTATTTRTPKPPTPSPTATTEGERTTHLFFPLLLQGWGK